jgi:hypothetical protein
LTDRDFSGLIGEATVSWKATGKTQVNLIVSRDLSNLADEISNYAVIDAVQLEPSWDITAKTTLRGTAAFERRDFKGADELLLIEVGLPDRQDDVTLAELWLDWKALRNVTLSLGYGYENRNSTREIWNYNADFIEARFSIGL